MRWIRSRTAVVALVGAVAVLTIALGNWQGWLVQAQGDVIWVNDADDVGEPEECDTSTALASITTALAEVDEAEDIIRLCEGTYPGDVTVDRSVTIEGREGAARADVVIEVEPAAPADGLVVEADDVTIRHLTLNGPDKNNTGIDVLGGAPPSYEGIEISDVEVTDWDDGIHTEDARGMLIEDSYLHDSKDDNLAMVHGTGNVVQGNTITDSDDDGLSVRGEDDLLVEGNTLSGSANNQVRIQHRMNVRIYRNQIDTTSDGIWIGSVPAETFIQIGGSPQNANSFSGPFGDPDYYVELDCTSQNTVDATYNYWGGAGLSRTAIANRIFNDEDDLSVECGAPNDVKGSVVFHPWATEPAPTPTPSPTPSPTATATPSPTPSPTPAATPPPVAATRDFDLYPGWNDFVWTGPSGTAPATVLSCIEDDYSIAYRFIESSQMFERQVPGETMLSNMTDVDQYDSLLVHVSASGVQCLGMPVEP